MTTLRASHPEFVTSTAADTETVYQLVKRGDVNPADVEDASTHAAEVTLLWDRSVLHVAHLGDAQSFSLRDHAAPDGVAHFVVDAAMLDGLTAADIVQRDVLGTRFMFLPGSQGEVELDGVRRDLTTLIAEGIARPSPSIAGAYEVNLVAGARCRMDLHGLTLHARLVPVGRRFAQVTRRDPAMRAAWGGSALAMAALLGMMRLATTDSAMLTNDDRDQRLAELRDFVARQSAIVESTPEEHEGAAADAPAGAAHQGMAGAMGDRQSTARNRRYEIRRTNEAPHLAREVSARDQVANRGMFAALGGPAALAGGSHSGIVSPWGAMTEAGTGDRNANGNLNGDDVGDSFGGGGLDTVGTGIGGGGHEQGIGTGPLGTQGHGNCPVGANCEYGRRVGTLRNDDRATHGPRVRTDPNPNIEGTIAPEAIRRVVLRNLGQVNRCYEQGLSINPSAAGRVAIRFVIAGGGEVLMTGVANDSLGIASVSSCIASAVRRWTFPVPADSGPITVTYPFNLMPADQ